MNSKSDETKLCYSVREMAKILGIGMNKAYNLANKAGFPAIRLEGRIVIPVQALADWLNQQAGMMEQGGLHNGI